MFLTSFSISMIAFHIFGRPIYRYWIVYTCGFLIWYYRLLYMWKKINAVRYPWLSNVLSHDLDGILLWIMLGVIIGGRLGEVFLYNWSYYSQHLDQIIAIWNWWMSFVWGFIGVAIAIFYYANKNKLKNEEIFLLFDYIVFILPLIIAFGRIANGLNQELYGKIINLSSTFVQYNYELLYNLNCIRIYDLVDNNWRRNTNMLESVFEWFLIFWIFLFLFIRKIVWWIMKPWYITWLFCIIYWIIRMLLENFRDNPWSEYIFWFLKSQILMILMIILWVFIIKIPFLNNDDEIWHS